MPSQLELNEFQDLVVVYWNAGTGVGVARLPKSNRGDGVVFLGKDIVTLGEETLKPGSKIRGRPVPDPKNAGQFKVVEVEIYVSQPEEPLDANFVASMGRAKGLKRYQTEDEQK